MLVVQNQGSRFMTGFFNEDPNLSLFFDPLSTFNCSGNTCLSPGMTRDHLKMQKEDQFNINKALFFLHISLIHNNLK